MIGITGAIIGGLMAGAMFLFNKTSAEPEKVEPEVVPVKQIEESKESEAMDTDVFTCPITCQTIREPATTIYGHLYEHQAILDWVAKKQSCPLTGQPLRAD